jgi:hypothetical protein
MREAPENMDYGTATQENKFAKADALTSHLEKGKYDTARAGNHGAELDGTAAMRLKGMGSTDPLYGDSHKNMC